MKETLESARQALDREEYGPAARLLAPLAEAGIAEAQYLLGSLYFTSADVKVEESRRWLRKAVAQDHPEATYLLARWRDDGTVGIPDAPPLRALLLRAADLGSVPAQRDLGCCYATGDDGWPLDLALARHWYGQAAAHGHADAQYNFGLMLLLGEGGTVDPVGREWIERAAAQGDAAAVGYLRSVAEQE